MTKISKKTQATSATHCAFAYFATADKTVHTLTQFAASLVVELDKANAEIARLKGEKRPPRFLEAIRRASNRHS